MQKHDADIDIQNIYALTVKDEEIYIEDYNARLFPPYKLEKYNINSSNCRPLIRYALSSENDRSIIAEILIITIVNFNKFRNLVTTNFFCNPVGQLFVFFKITFIYCFHE